MPSSPPGLKYIKELDALRAIAIISVLYNHWFSVEGRIYIISFTISAPGIFFTLSGVLITKILLGERKKAEALHLSKVQVFKISLLSVAFTLCLLNLVIILTYLISGQPKDHFYQHLFFYTNFHQYFTKSWEPMAHLWTMSVE